MGLRINTNIGALRAHNNLYNNSAALDTSLERLSSGLRINWAKDNASGLAIADQLRTQASSLKQAIDNGNEAMSVLTVADKAIEEQVNILDSIKQKAISAAQDGQSTKTRNMLQADINRLMEELDNIANSTSFNGKQLLSGGYINQEYQIGDRSNTTVKTSIGPTMSSKIGVTRFETGANVTASGLVNMVIKNYNGVEDFKFAEVTISYSVGTGLGALTEEINRVSDRTGVRATHTVQTYGVYEIKRGTTSRDFSINGVIIGQIEYQDADKNGQLIQAINAVKDTTGVEAARDANGKLILNSADGRGIVIGGDPGVGSGIVAKQRTNFGRLHLVRNNGQDVPISGTGNFGFISPAFVSQQSLSLRDTKGRIEGNNADALGFFAYPGGSKYIITMPAGVAGTLSNWMSGASGFSAGSGYSIGTTHRYSVHLADKFVFVSVNGWSKAYNVSTGSGFSAGSGKSQFAPMKTGSTALFVIDRTAGVTTLKGAMAVMDVSETAILNLDQTRADIGSAQQQIQSTLNNITVTQVNVKSAESIIRDVDFAEESANFSKYNILAQSGSYAMAQANTSQQYVMQLLQ